MMTRFLLRFYYKLTKMFQERNLGFIILMGVETALLASLPTYMHGLEGSIVYFMSLYVVLFADAFIATVMFFSPLTSLIYFLGLSAMFSAIGVNLIDPVDLVTYFSGLSSGSFILFLVRRSFSDTLVSHLSRISVRRPGLRHVVLSVLMLFAGVVIYLVFGTSLLLLYGFLFNFIVIMFSSDSRVIPLLLMSWASSPLLLFSTGGTSTEGVLLGRVRKALMRSSSSTRFRGNSYTWVGAGNSEFRVNLKGNKNYNVVIVGASGSGKSFLVKHMIKQLNLSFTVFDLHGEYQQEGVDVNRVDMSRSSINPLSLNNTSPRKRSLEVAYMIRSIFNLGNLQTIDVFNLISETYMENGIEEEDPRTWSQRPPTFRDVLIYLERKKRLSNSSQDVNRLSSIEPYLVFLSTEVFSRDSLNMEEVFEKNTILDFSGVSANEIKYVMIETILRNLRDYMTRRGQSPFWKVFVLDEAPFVLSKDTGKETVERIFAEGRKFGVGMMVVSQSLEYVKKLMNNSAAFFIFQLSEPTEVDYVVRFLAGDSDAYMLIHDTAMSMQRGEFLTRTERGDIFLVRSITE